MEENRIKNIENIILFGVLLFLLYKYVWKWLLQNIPQEGIKIIFWGTGILVISFVIGSIIGLLVYNLFLIMQNAGSNLFEIYSRNKKFWKWYTLIPLILVFLITFGIYLYYTISNATIEDWEKWGIILKPVTYTIMALTAIVSLIIKFKRKK